MIKDIVSDAVGDGAYSHSKRVSSEIELLQSNGYNVYKVEKLKRMFLGFFGESITRLHYEQRKRK